MDEVVVVCGYGVYLDPWLRGYLAAVARYVRDRRDKVVCVIVSGGYTHQASFPGISEAAVMGKFLRRLGVEALIIREEEAVTTPDNLRFSQDLVEHLRISPETRITIFCDSIREVKVKFLAKRVFADREVLVISHDFARSLKQRLKQLFTTPLEIAAFYFPIVERRLRGVRLSLNARR